MNKRGYSLIRKGDVIRTNPEEGFYGIAVVLDEPERIELAPGKLSIPFCHIAITPLIFRHEVTFAELDPESFSPLRFQTFAIRDDGSRIPWRVELCIQIYTYRNKANFPIIGNIDPSGIYNGELVFKPQEDRFFMYGDVDKRLGRMAYISYMRQFTET